MKINDFSGDPGRSRTCDLRFRKPSLYPSELQGHATTVYHRRNFRRSIEMRPWRRTLFCHSESAQRGGTCLWPAALSALVRVRDTTGLYNSQFRWARNRADKSSVSRFLRAARFRNDKKRAHREGDNFRRERIAGMLPRCATSPQSLSCWASANRNPVALLSGHRQRRVCYTGFY